MTFTLKRTLVYTALAALTVWPAVHIWLVKSYGVSAWKLGGWGMYAAPRPKFVGLEVFYREPGMREYQRLRQAGEPVTAASRSFIERYRWLGMLASPDDFARRLLKMNPGWEEVQVVVYQPSLERDSGMMRMREGRFTQAARGGQ